MGDFVAQLDFQTPCRAIHNHVWYPPPTNLTLADGEVHVWKMALELPTSQLQYLRSLLSADEIDRADRFRFDKDRQHYISGRGTLRTILGRYLRVFPGHLRFNYTHYGKPLPAANFDHYGLKFNLSNSEGLILYTFTRNQEIGIDLERIYTDFEYEAIAEPSYVGALVVGGFSYNYKFWELSFPSLEKQ